MIWLQEVILDPLTVPFMQRALMASLLIGCSCAVFSCFLVLKGWSLMGDAVAHSVLPGLALAYLFGIPMAIGAFVAGLFCALGTGFVKAHSRLKEDAVMGIFFSGMFAFGLVLLSRVESEVNLLHVLFGNVLGIRPHELLESALIAGFSMVFLLLKRKDFLLYCFDPTQAHISALSNRFLHFSLLVVLALTIVSALKAAGIILVIAMLIAPGAIAHLLTQSFDQMLMVAVGTAIFSSFAGVLLSFHFDLATAPSIVLTQSFIFILCFVSRPRSLHYAH